MIRASLVTFILLFCFIFGCESKLDYQAQKTYIYDYQGYLLSGLPGFNSRFDGFLVEAKVHLSREKVKSNKFILRFVDPTVRRVHDSRKLPDPLSTNQLPRLKSNSLFLKILVTSADKKTLQLPIAFEWNVNGLIEKVFVHKKDLYWSSNLKKSVLSILSAQLKEVQEKSFNNASYMNFYENKREYGVEGVCDALYSYKANFTERANGYTVVRQKQTASCSSVPVLNQIFFPMEKSVKNSAKWLLKNGLEPTSFLEYQITMSKNNFFIHQVIGSSSYNLINDEKSNLKGAKALSRQELVFESMKSGVKSQMFKEFDRKEDNRKLLMKIINPFELRKIDTSKSYEVVYRMIGSVYHTSEDSANVWSARKMSDILSLIRRMSSGSLSKFLRITLKYR